MSYTIEPIRTDSSDREEVIHFLLESPGQAHSPEKWRARLNHWWEANPAAGHGQPWGWTLRHEGQVVGILGCIPVMYELDGAEVPAAAATTWRVAEAHRSQSLRLFMELLKLARQMPVLNSSPIAAAGQVLEKAGFQFRKTCTRHHIVMGWWLGWMAASVFSKGRSLPKLERGLRLVADPAEVRAVLRGVTHSTMLERQVSPAYLQWLMRTPMEDLHFLGCVTEDGTLSSYLVLLPFEVKGMRGWLTADWFTARDSAEELQTLVVALCREPGLVPGGSGARVLVAASFEGDESWSGLPAFYQREAPALYYYALPPALKAVQKHCVLAESDFLI